MKRAALALAVAAVLVLAAGAAAACAREDAAGREGGVRTIVPGLANDAPHTRTRSYGMGFFFAGPDPTIPGAIELGKQLAKHGEYVLIQRDVPWSALAAGLTLEEA
jgi:hypothetical protein